MLIIDVEDAEAGYRLASSAPGVHCVRPKQLLSALHAADRDVAVRFFSPIADALTDPGNGPLVLPCRWPERLPLATQRILTRAALSLGAVLATPRGDPTLERPGASADLGLLVRPPGALAGVPRRGFSGPLGLAALAYQGWANPGPGAGAFRPGVALLVGERPGVARNGELKHRLPFTTFVRAGCAHWLADGLESVHVPESALYWINAYDALGIPTRHDFVSDLQPARVVALGNLAERWCVAAHLDHSTVPHPQYWKRFHPKEPYPLLSLLKGQP